MTATAERTHQNTGVAWVVPPQLWDKFDKGYAKEVAGQLGKADFLGTSIGPLNSALDVLTNAYPSTTLFAVGGQTYGAIATVLQTRGYSGVADLVEHMNIDDPGKEYVVHHPGGGRIVLVTLPSAVVHDPMVLRKVAPLIHKNYQGTRPPVELIRQADIHVLDRGVKLEGAVAAMRQLLNDGVCLDRILPDLNLRKYLQHWPRVGRKALDPVFMARPFVVFDTETVVSKVDPSRLTIWHHNSGVICCSFTVVQWDEIGECFRPTSLVVPKKEWFGDFFRWVTQKASVGVAHNLNYDVQAVHKWGDVDFEETLPFRFCSMGAAYSLNTNVVPERMGGHGIGVKGLCRYYLGSENWEAPLDELATAIQYQIQCENQAITKENKALAKQGLPLKPLREPFTYLDLPYPDLALYCGYDTGNTAAIFCYILQEMIRIDREEPNDGLSLREYYFNLYSPMVNDIAAIEQRGIHINREVMAESQGVYEREAERLTRIITAQPIVQQLAAKGVSINVRSTDFASALIEATKMERFSKKTKGGNWCCDKAVLNKLRAKDIPHNRKTYEQQLWNYVYFARRNLNLISKNITPTLPYILPDGKVRPTYKTAKMEVDAETDSGGTKTSRITTQNPSSNTWIKDKSFLRCLDAKPGDLIIKGDWKSIEPLGHALMAKSKKWMEVFWNVRNNPTDLAADLYRATYGPVLGIPPEHVTSEQRDEAKVFLLAMLYDRHPNSVATALGISLEYAYELCNEFWKAFPELAERSNRVKLEFLKGRPIRNVFGQRVFYPNRAQGGAYSAEVVEYVEKNLMRKPLYQWSEDPWLMGQVHKHDFDDCRKVGNWEIQSFGWTLTSTMIGVLNRHIQLHDPDGGIIETIHDAYKAYVAEEVAGDVLETAYDVMYDLSKGRLGNLPGTEKLLKRLGLKTLRDIPVTIEFEYGPNSGAMEKHKRGQPLWA